MEGCRLAVGGLARTCAIDSEVKKQCWFMRIIQMTTLIKEEDAGCDLLIVILVGNNKTNG